MLVQGAFGYLVDYLLIWFIFLSLVAHTWCFFRFFPRRRFRRTALVVGNTLLFLCLLGVVFLVGESYLRFAAVGTDSFGVSLPARRWFALHTKLNAQGFRDREWAIEKPVGMRRIAFVGDSFTYGWGVEDVADRFPDRIQALWDAQAPHSVEVLNFARPGWNTDDYALRIPEIIDTRGVDEIVWCYVLNDIEWAIPTTADFNPTRPPEPTWFNPDSSVLADFLYRRLWLPRVPTVRGYIDWLADGYANPDVWRAQQEQLDAVVKDCRSRSVMLRVALLPYLRVSGERDQRGTLHAQLRGFLESRGIEVVDLLPTIAGVDTDSLAVNRGDPHPNARAHERFARGIWEAFYAKPAN